MAGFGQNENILKFRFYDKSRLTKSNLNKKYS